MVGFWLLMRDAHLWSLALLLAFGCSDSPKSVAASSQSHLPSFLLACLPLPYFRYRCWVVHLSLYLAGTG